jgi:hypothetical protein
VHGLANSLTEITQNGTNNCKQTRQPPPQSQKWVDKGHKKIFLGKGAEQHARKTAANM